jgi:hypothetical protein
MYAVNSVLEENSRKRMMLNYNMKVKFHQHQEIQLLENTQSLF